MSEDVQPPSRPRRLTAKGAATRARIVRAAAELMYAQGVERTTLDEVIGASGTGKSQLYYHFADKNELVDEVVHWQVEEVLGVQRPLLRDLDSMSELERWRDAIVANVQRRDGAYGCPIGSLSSELSEDSETARREIERGFLLWEEQLRAGLHRMQERGELQLHVDPAALATGLIAALQGGYLLAQARRDATSLQIALDMALDHVRSLTRDSGGGSVREGS